MYGQLNQPSDDSCYYTTKHISRTISSAYHQLLLTYSNNSGSNWHFYLPPGVIRTKRGLSDIFALEYSQETHCFASYTTRCMQSNFMCNYAKSKLLENALRLDDIPKWWSTNEGYFPAQLMKPGKKPYDDAELDFPSVYKESQKYNECVFLNFLLLEALKEHLLIYCIRSFNFNYYLIQSLFWKFTKLTLFEQLIVFGYECFVDCEMKDFRNDADAVIAKHMKNLAVTFGVESALGEIIVAGCDTHFVLSGRSRMPYCKLFDSC